MYVCMTKFENKTTATGIHTCRLARDFALSNGKKAIDSFATYNNKAKNN